MTHRILFATNRNFQGLGNNGRPKFGDEVAPFGGENLLCATAAVEDVTLSDPDAGRISGASTLHPGGFAEADLEPILAPDNKNDVLVFIHGAANTFRNSLARAAYNKEWLSRAKVKDANTDFDIIAFSWPATEYDFWKLFLVYFSYEHDQGCAQASYHHFGTFFRALYKLRARLGKRRMSLLAHSMGNYALGFAVQDWYRHPNAPVQPLFDDIILAAPDEPDTAFNRSKGGHFADLSRLGRRITLYFNRDDILMELSHLANQNTRLGYDGPPNAGDTKIFPTKLYNFIDCTDVDDYVPGTGHGDRTHQYYRQSKKVRADIAAVLAGQTPKRQKYDETANWYVMFP